MRWTLGVDRNGFSCSYSNRIGDFHSVSMSCSWHFLKLCVDSRGELLFLRMLDLQTAKDRRLRKGSGYFWINIQQRLFSKERMKRTDEELDRLCKIEKVRRNLEDLEILANKGLQEAKCSAHLEDRTPRGTHILLNLVVWPVHAWALNNHARMRDSSLHTSIILVMFGAVCSIAHHKHLFIHDVSSRSSRSSSWVIHLVLLCTTSTTSDGTLYAFGEGIADRNQDPLKRNAAGGTVRLSGRLFRSHRLWAQDLHRRQQWAHSDQLRLQKEDLQHWG